MYSYFNVRKGFILNLTFITLGSLLFLLPLLHAWMLYPLGIVNERTSYSAIAGMIPYSDAFGYYQGANKFLEAGFLDDFSTRRPINAIFFSVRLWLFNGSFKGAMLMQALLCGFCCMLVVKGVVRKFGVVSGIFTLFVLFMFASCFIPTTLTETLGLTLGCLAFVFIWSAIDAPNPITLFFAGLMLMVGMNTRSGAFFIIPLLIFWLGYNFKHNAKFESFNWKIACVFLCGLVAGIVYNKILIGLFADLSKSGGAFNANFADTLFGVVSGGKGWTYAKIVFSDMSFTSEAERAHFLYSKSFEVFIHNPFLLLKGLLRGMLALGWHLIGFFQSNSPSCLFLKYFINFSGLILSIFAVSRLVKLYPKFPGQIGLLVVGLIGLILSAGVIWTDGGIRVFAVTVPYFAVALGVAFGSINLFQIRKSLFDTDALRNDTMTAEAKIAVFISSLFLTTVLVVPYFFNSQQFDFDVLVERTCLKPNEALFVARKVYYAPYVNIVNNQSLFIDSIRNNPTIENQKMFLDMTKPKLQGLTSTLGVVTEWKTGNSKIILGPKKLFETKHKLVSLCLVGLNDNQVFQVISYKELK